MENGVTDWPVSETTSRLEWRDLDESHRATDRKLWRHQKRVASSPSSRRLDSMHGDAQSEPRQPVSKYRSGVDTLEGVYHFSRLDPHEAWRLFVSGNPDLWGSMVSADESDSTPRGESRGDLSLNPARRVHDTLEDAPGPGESEEILQRLASPAVAHEVQRQAVIDAEIVDFGPEQARALTPRLRAFIERHRESNVPADVAAVGSAVRKFIAIASPNEAFEFTAGLLEASARSPLPIRLEIELCKMALRKLTANPPAGAHEHSLLARRLKEVADTYLNPRLISREKHGAVALVAVLGLMLTHDPSAAAIVERVRTLSVPWFQQLVARRAAELARELREKSAPASLIQSLDDLSAAADPAGPS